MKTHNLNVIIKSLFVFLNWELQSLIGLINSHKQLHYNLFKNDKLNYNVLSSFENRIHRGFALYNLCNLLLYLKKNNFEFIVGATIHPNVIKSLEKYGGYLEV